MRLVVDANILFAALIKDSTTAEILLHENIKFIIQKIIYTYKLDR